MSTDDGTTDEQSRANAQRPRLDWWNDPETGRARLAEQVAMIVAALGGPTRVGVYDQAGGQLGSSGDWGDMRYMFHRERILVRDGDLDRVRAALTGADVSSEIVEDGISGLTVLQVVSAERALQVVDAALGKGVAYPDHVLYVTPDGCACPATEPLVPLDPRPHPTRKVHRSCDGTGVFVAVVDTGFDAVTAEHTRWLAGVTGEQEDIDRHHMGPYVGHGTFVAGIVRTMAPATEVYVHSFLPHGGAIFESAIVQQLREAILDSPDIISMSAGTRTRDNAGLLSFKVLWEELDPKGTVLIAAAGNDGSRQPFYPAAETFAIGVGAIDPDGARAGYSNHGPWVDVYALGTSVVNAFPNGTYDYAEEPLVGRSATFTRWTAEWSGTSFATPLVAGLVAARMTWSGENGQLAAQGILAQARANARRGVGAVAEPWMGCRPT